MMTDQCLMRWSPIFSWVKLGQEDSLQVLLYFYDDISVSYEIESYIELGKTWARRLPACFTLLL